ncbi:MAG: T9SS type A sorting domain-containing protein [Bacteroidota bacterium]|nr:T9SS type A sorting domain-containing protein [Bacteroidota bacterium]
MPNALFHSYTNRKDVLFQKNTHFRSSNTARPKGLYLFALFLFLFASLCCLTDVQAQWQLLAPSLLGPQNIDRSVIVHKAGLTWAGTKEVFMSPDSGMTWSKRWSAPLGNDAIADITFYDNNIGLVCTHDGKLYRTDDQGLSWTQLQGFAGATTAAFLGSPADIIVTSGTATVAVSRDGGLTWKSTVLDSYVEQVRPLLGGSAMVFAANYTSLQGSIYRTNDYGVTWQKMTGLIDLDSYSFEVDPCDPSFIYSINEEGTTQTDKKGAIFISSDGGNSFTQTQVSPTQYFCGSISRTTKALFVQTVANGIIRSTDHGTSWKSIGGPGAMWDSRLVCAINSNIILAGDANGSIWRTISSGGDSLLNTSAYESLVFTPQELFVTDSLVSCDSPIVETLHLHAILCNYPKIMGQHISGADSNDYRIIQPIGDSLSGNDSIILSFRPFSSGPQQGEYIITLEDGTQVAIPLKGFGRNIILVEPATQNITLDTIGGFAQVPIQFKGFSQNEDLDIVLHYDQRLIYNRSISLSGTALDLPGEAWQGRVKLRIPRSEMQLDTITGIAIFTVFPDGADCYNVSLDSMDILNPFAPCTYSIGNPVTATICPPKGCGIMTLTNYLLHGTMPQLSIQPNPSQDHAFITSSASLGITSVEIIDIVGRTLQRKSIILSKGVPTKIDLKGINSGSYFLLVKTPEFQYRLPLAITR